MRHTDRDRRGWREDNRKQDYQSMKGIDTDPYMPVSKNEAGGRVTNGKRSTEQVQNHQPRPEFLEVQRPAKGDDHQGVARNQPGRPPGTAVRGHSDPRPVVSHPVARRQNRIQPVGPKPVPDGAVAETPMRKDFPLRK